jgi:hypothetical protein
MSEEIEARRRKLFILFLLGVAVLYAAILIVACFI